MRENNKNMYFENTIFYIFKNKKKLSNKFFNIKKIF